MLLTDGTHQGTGAGQFKNGRHREGQLRVVLFGVFWLASADAQ